MEKTPTAPTRRLALAGILVTFCVLGLVYSVSTPIFEASDEPQHYPYVKHIADGRGLPIPSPDPALNPAHQEGTQPPLYYAVGALATFWIDTGDVNDLYKLNPHAQKGRPDSRENKNMVVHTGAEAFPYRGVALAVHVVRWLSVAMGAVTVLLTFLIVSQVEPDRPSLALGAAAVNALIPMFLFISGAVNNDNLIALCASLTLFLLVRFVRREYESPRTSFRGWELVAVGVAAGLAALTKLSGLALLPVIGGTLLWLAWRRRSLKHLIVWGALAFGAAFAVAGWWYARNWIVYGDPTLISQHVAIVRGRPVPVTLLDLLANETQGLRWSFWGVFGGFNVVADTAIYHFYDLLTVLALLGLVLAGTRHYRRSKAVAGIGGGSATPGRAVPGDRPASRDLAARVPPAETPPVWLFVAILGGWSFVLLASLLRWSLLTMASQGRLLFPAISAISLGLYLGWQSLIPRLDRRLVLALVAAPLLMLAALMPIRYIRPTYAQPDLLPPGAIKAQLGGETIDVSFDDKLELVAVRLSEPRIAPGRPVLLDLYWRTLAPPDRDYSVYVHLYDGAGKVVARLDTYPSGGKVATSLLSPGDELHDRYVLSIDQDASPGEGHLDVGLYEFPSMARLQPYDGARRPLPSPNVASFRVYAPALAPSPPSTTTSVRYGEAIELVGYSLESAEVATGTTLHGALYWRARSRPNRDYTIFVHLASRDQPPVVQADAQPQGGAYPTALWREGDLVYHPFALALRPDVAPGAYELLVGLYDQPTGRRLEVTPDPLRRALDRLRRATGQAVTVETASSLQTVRVQGR